MYCVWYAWCGDSVVCVPTHVYWLYLIQYSDSWKLITMPPALHKPEAVKGQVSWHQNVFHYLYLLTLFLIILKKWTLIFLVFVHNCVISHVLVYRPLYTDISVMTSHPKLRHFLVYDYLLEKCDMPSQWNFL